MAEEASACTAIHNHESYQCSRAQLGDSTGTCRGWPQAGTGVQAGSGSPKSHHQVTEHLRLGLKGGMEELKHSLLTLINSFQLCVPILLVTAPLLSHSPIADCAEIAYQGWIIGFGGTEIKLWHGCTRSTRSPRQTSINADILG